ncbi:hypothetical protein F4778DRAFT_321614 [Xylariomycetidae sp. FL2044]|nr:hypothetical protein F4778DRAFT_321614 [Xylariomycetidae sp. FL2044]
MFGKARIPTYDPSAAAVERRQYVEDDDGRLVWFWYTKEGVIIKWSLFLGIVILFSAYLVGGRIHAKRRLAKGMKPLAYHGWLLSRQERARVDPQYAWPQAQYSRYQPAGPGPQQQQQQYGMYAMPPPVYDPNRPPMYEGGPDPMGGSKVDPQQTGFETARPPQQGGGDVYAPPPGPPPPAR